MVYNSVAEIFEAIDDTRSRLYALVGGLSEEQARRRPEGGGWSVAELVEHLSMTEQLILKRFSGALNQAESAGTPAPPATGIWPISLEHLASAAAAQKFEAPEPLRPSTESRPAESLDRMRGTRQELRAMRPRFEAADLSAIGFPHPVFGQLNLYQWLAFVGLHEERHLRQMDQVLTSDGPHS